MAGEHISAGTGAYASGSTAIAFGVGGGAALVLVMLWQIPKTKREWALSLSSTMFCSIFGGAFVVQYLGLDDVGNGFLGLVRIAGVIAACGIPGWAIVRAAFTWMDRRRDMDIGELARSVKDDAKNIL